MVLEEISLNLINVADRILEESSKISQSTDTLEFTKKSRKYKLVNNENFHRIRESDKYLIVADNFNDLRQSYSLISSYYILRSLEGDVLHNEPDLCLAIMGAARELELNKWYDLDICVTVPQEASYDPFDAKAEALKFASKITRQHINNGLLLLCASKINFFHTDHTASKKVEGICLRKLMSGLFGEDSLQSEPVYNAIRCFSHWGSIKGVLYKLEAKNLYADDDLQIRYRNFPDPPAFFKQCLNERYPTGTSKYMLCKKLLMEVAASPYGKLLPMTLDVHWLFKLCREIEADPCRFHLRSSTKNLSRSPVNLSKLDKPDELLTMCAAIIYGSNELIGKDQFNSSKVPKKQAVKSHPLYQQTKTLNTLFHKYNFRPYSAECGTTEAEIVAKVGDLGSKSIYHAVTRETDNL